MGPVSDLGTIQMVLDIPDGLTYTLGSGKLAAGLKGKLGFDSLDYTESQKDGKTRVMINGVASSADYASATDTQIATFRCTVDAGATGKLSVGLTELEFISCQTFDDFTGIVNGITGGSRRFVCGNGQLCRCDRRRVNGNRKRQHGKNHDKAQ